MTRYRHGHSALGKEKWWLLFYVAKSSNCRLSKDTLGNKLLGLNYVAKGVQQGSEKKNLKEISKGTKTR